MNDFGARKLNAQLVSSRNLSVLRNSYEAHYRRDMILNDEELVLLKNLCDYDSVEFFVYLIRERGISRDNFICLGIEDEIAYCYFESAQARVDLQDIRAAKEERFRKGIVSINELYAQQAFEETRRRLRGQGNSPLLKIVRDSDNV